jgi:hypothetical protein
MFKLFTAAVLGTALLLASGCSARNHYRNDRHPRYDRRDRDRDRDRDRGRFRDDRYRPRG